MKNRGWISLLLIVTLGLSGCSSTSVAREWNQVQTPDGTPLAHMRHWRGGVHLFFGKVPFLGNASLEKNVDEFTKKARLEGATTVRIVHSDTFSWWFIFFPFTLLITPVTSTVSGDLQA